jgi:hypothetical protein
VALLCQKIALGKVDIALIQEPWVQEGQIKGQCGTMFLLMLSVTLRSCIYVRNYINTLLLLDVFQGHSNGEDIIQE